MHADLLDLNDGVANRGVAAILGLLASSGRTSRLWEVRQKHELPPMDSELWVLSGGPGSPLAEGPWRAPLLAALRARIAEDRPTLAICYGFELLGHALGAELRELTTPRDGVFPLRLTLGDPRFSGLQGAGAYEGRRWGVFGEVGEVLATGGEGDLTAARFGQRGLGVIFHPEADLGPDTALVYSTLIPRYLAGLR